MSSLKTAVRTTIGLFAISSLAAAQTRDTGFVRTEAMIPMRDGVHLHTVILRPTHARSPLPILLTRTPFGAAYAGGTPAWRRSVTDLMRDGYIFVFQDIRGTHQSEGSFVVNRPQRRTPQGVDESTDAYDTIDWLIHHLPNTNGRVGITGISYGGWLAAVAGIGPHPALKAISPQAPTGDTWMGDDFFHQGAFRLSSGLEFAWELEDSVGTVVYPTISRYDTYDWYGSFPSLSALAHAVGANAWPTWRQFVAHPAYDSVWQERALSHTFRHTTVPTLVVGGWWDQEDEYGPIETYRTLAQTDTARIVAFVMGPWSHRQWFADSGRTLGDLRFGRATGVDFRALEARWFAHWLHDSPQAGGARGPVEPGPYGAPPRAAPTAATVFDAGDSTWRTFARWPPRTATHRHLYFGSGGALSETPPRAVDAADRYVSDPAHPVPYQPRPIELIAGPESRWPLWRTDDQRFVDGRPDVLTWQTPPLTSDITVAGNVVARLYASTTGSDADWVVKLIDVYPDSVPHRPRMGGYELMIAADIMRGRYRTSFEHPAPIPPGVVEVFTVDLQQQAYTFRRGHRIMVQVQSSWFPAYDVNPQTFVSNIFFARATDYRPQTHTIYRSATAPSNVEFDALTNSQP